MSHVIPGLIFAALALFAFALWDYLVERWHAFVAVQVERQLAARVATAIQVERERQAQVIARAYRAHDEDIRSRIDAAVAEAMTSRAPHPKLRDVA